MLHFLSSKRVGLEVVVLLMESIIHFAQFLHTLCQQIANALQNHISQEKIIEDVCYLSKLDHYNTAQYIM